MILALKQLLAHQKRRMGFSKQFRYFNRTFKQPVCVCVSRNICDKTFDNLLFTIEFFKWQITSFGRIHQSSSIVADPYTPVPNNESHSSPRLNASPNIERQIKKECQKRKEIKITNFGVPKIDLDSQPKCQKSLVDKPCKISN